MKYLAGCLLLIFVLALPTASAQVQLADFAGIWERAGPGRGGGPDGGPASDSLDGPGGGPRGERRQRPGAAAGDASAADAGGVTLGLGAPAPNTGRGPTIPAADAALGLDAGDLRIRRQMTDAGRAKFATFRPIEHPMNNCISPGLPTVAGMPGRQAWTVDADTIRISHETWPEPRTTTLGAPMDASAPHTRAGQSTARIEGDALIITTTRLTEAWGGLGRNAPGSAERTITETYRRVGADRITGDILITDPTFLTEPLRRPVSLRRAPADAVIEMFPCELEASQLLVEK